jgi:hypothetical protein
MHSETNPENLDPEKELDSECEFCGEPCEHSFCNKDCRKAYESDMNDDC